MTATRSAALGAALGLMALSVAGCERQSEEQRTKSALEGRNPRGDNPRSLDDRIPSYEGERIGPQPGYVEGAFMYASVRAEIIGALWQSAPASRWELAAVDGLLASLDGNPAVGLVLEQFGIDAAARVSISARSIGPSVALRSTLEHGGPLIDELAARDASRRSKEATALLQQAQSIGSHVRVHVPVIDRQRFETSVEALLETLFVPGTQPGVGANTCATLGPNVACAEDQSSLLVVRLVGEGYVADLLELSSAGADDAQRHALIQASLALPGSTSRPELEALGGDAVLLIDGPAMVEAVRADLVSTMYSALERGESSTLEGARKLDEGLRRLHETERMFDGATLEVSLADQRLLARGRWLVSETGRERLRSVFELDPVDADVPSIAALCDKALMCGRSRGLPARQRFVGLATGLEALASVAKNEAVALSLLETWPNVIGTAWLLPTRLGNSAETMVLQGAAELGARVLGFGFSIRSQRSVDEGRIVYARMSAADLDSLRSLMQLGGASFSTVRIAGVDGRVESTPRPTSTLPDRLYAVYDPDQWGWAVAADDDDQVAWLASLAHDDGAVPIVYFEIPDLGQLIEADVGLTRDYGGLASKLAKRGIRAQLTLTPSWAPEARFMLGKLD